MRDISAPVSPESRYGGEFGSPVPNEYLYPVMRIFGTVFFGILIVVFILWVDGFRPAAAEGGVPDVPGGTSGAADPKAPAGGSPGEPATAGSKAKAVVAVPPEITGEREMKALLAAYPERVAEAAVRDGEWALRIDDAWFYWAEGRILPEADRDRWKEYTGLRFYPYPRGLPPLRVLDEEAKQRLRQRLDEAAENPPRRSEAFLSRLYNAGTREETEANLVRAGLMGFSVRLHSLAAAKLEAVDRDLRILAGTDPEVRRFFGGLSHIGGYHWRPIAGTASRSYHGYGIALDLIAKDWGGKQYYWRNIMGWDDEWYALPYEERWMVPLPVVEAFEKHGFIWGGKWLYFDTVHFEYRPELLILRGQ
jgi:hypothetical protein